MTITEAKANLNYAIRWNDRPSNESMEMAIKSLEWQEEFMDTVYEQNLEAEFYINGRRFRVREVPQ